VTGNGNVPFPLFGYNFLLHPEIAGQDTAATNMDQLGAMGSPPCIDCCYICNFQSLRSGQ
jgi:hypothetical protein